MTDPARRTPWSVLFLCTGNSARSILAEALLRHWGDGRFVAHSAGSDPRGEIQPQALELLAASQISVAGLRSKSVDELLGADAPAIDFVITVCDAAAEQCPVLPGRPLTAHWGMPDPAAVGGTEDERRQAYRRAFIELERRVRLLVELPLAGLDRLARQERLRAIGHPDPGGHAA